MSIHIEKISPDSPFAEAYFSIRKNVFVIEQNVDENLEKNMENEAIHFLAFYNNTPAGAARYRMTGEGIKLERFAVLKSFRNQGIASALLKFILSEIMPTGKIIYLHAQERAVGFYKKNGLTLSGMPFEEAGIVHYKMIAEKHEA